MNFNDINARTADPSPDKEHRGIGPPLPLCGMLKLPAVFPGKNRRGARGSLEDDDSSKGTPPKIGGVPKNRHFIIMTFLIPVNEPAFIRMK